MATLRSKLPSRVGDEESHKNYYFGFGRLRKVIRLQMIWSNTHVSEFRFSESISSSKIVKKKSNRDEAIYLELHVQILGCVVNALIFPIKGRTHVNRARWMWKRSSFVIVFQPFKCIRLKPQWPLYGRIICVMAVRVKKFATPYLQRRSIGDNANFWKRLDSVAKVREWDSDSGTMMSPHICLELDEVEDWCQPTNQLSPPWGRSWYEGSYLLICYLLPSLIDGGSRIILLPFTNFYLEVCATK